MAYLKKVSYAVITELAKCIGTVLAEKRGTACHSKFVCVPIVRNRNIMIPCSGETDTGQHLAT